MEIDYSIYLSRVGKQTTPHRLNELIAMEQDAGSDLYTLSIGQPAPEIFPIETIHFQLEDGTEIKLDSEETLEAQSYARVSGIPRYQDTIRDLVYTVHNPPCWASDNPDARTTVLATCGASDSINLMMTLLVDPGDHAIAEEVTYAGTTNQMSSLSVKGLPVTCDKNGMIPDVLREVLSRWDPDPAPGTTDRPKLMYVIPTGQNPSGSTMTLERKQEIYQIARKYQLLIVEDDPYHVITFGEEVPSFLSLDIDGRVIRLDSFSKFIAPGLRAGVISGPDAILRRVLARLGYSSCGTSPISQCLINGLFAQMSVAEFVKSRKFLAKLYKNQRDVMTKLAEKWLKGLVEYDIPSAGMFMWMKIVGCSDTNKLISQHYKDYEVLACPGEYFRFGDKAIDDINSYVRVSYSIHTEEIVDKAFQRLAMLIRQQVKPTALNN